MQKALSDMEKKMESMQKNTSELDLKVTRFLRQIGMYQEPE